MKNIGMFHIIRVGCSECLSPGFAKIPGYPPVGT